MSQQSEYASEYPSYPTNDPDCYCASNHACHCDSCQYHLDGDYECLDCPSCDCTIFVVMPQMFQYDKRPIHLVTGQELCLN